MIRIWDTADYRRIAQVDGEADGQVHILFYDGALITVHSAQIEPPCVDERLLWETAAVGDGHWQIDVLGESGDLYVIPWRVVRALTDDAFAAYLAECAEEQARLIGKRLRKLRHGRGFTASALAERAGLEPSAVHNLEYGHDDYVLATIGKCLAALGCTYHDLLSTMESEPDGTPI